MKHHSWSRIMSIDKQINNKIKGDLHDGGEGGIRTHGRLTPTPDFESGTFDHSATSPLDWWQL